MWHHHGSDTPTSARAILHHTDQKGPNILKGSVPLCVVEDDVSDADEDGNDVGDGVEAAEADHVEAVVEEIDAEHNQRPRRQRRPGVPNYRLSHQACQFRFRNSRHVAKP